MLVEEHARHSKDVAEHSPCFSSYFLKTCTLSNRHSRQDGLPYLHHNEWANDGWPTPSKGYPLNPLQVARRMWRCIPWCCWRCVPSRCWWPAIVVDKIRLMP